MSNKTLVTFLLDRTGSMESIRDDTIGAFNAYLETLQDGDENIVFSLLTFDSMSVDKVHVNQPVKEIPRLSRETYLPRASTPLIDAAYKTIKAVEASVNGSDAKVVICIQTDGQENASREHTWDDLNALIKEKNAAGWQFNFMGAGIDAYEQGKRMGISGANTMSYDSSDAIATVSAFKASASNTMSYARGASLNTAYSADQKLSSGDKFDPHSAAVDLGRRGGLKGGPARAESLSPERRQEIAKQAAQARWNKKIVDDITL